MKIRESIAGTAAAACDTTGGTTMRDTATKVATRKREPFGMTVLLRALEPRWLASEDDLRHRRRTK
jgi:hypothetical protein